MRLRSIIKFVTGESLLPMFALSAQATYCGKVFSLNFIWATKNTGFSAGAAKSTLGKQWDLCRGGSKNTTGTSVISEHAHETGHYPIWIEVRFIDRDPHWYTCRVKKAILIRLHSNNINRDSEIEIPEAWMPTIKKHNKGKTVQQWTAEGTATRRNNGTMGGSKYTNYSRSSWYKWCCVIMQPHSLEIYISSDDSVRQTILDFIINYELLLILDCKSFYCDYLWVDSLHLCQFKR